MTDKLYFKQIEMGPMQNFVYLVGSLETRKAAVVDAAWDIEEILRIVAEDEMELTHACVSHTHPDHIGGQFAGAHIEGVTELLEKAKVKVIVHKEEAENLKFLSTSNLIKADSGGQIDLGGIAIQFIHTPGHTPGSQCFFIDNRLVSGDTLFIGSCGRVDLPGGNAEQMYFSLTQRLMELPETTLLFPGHNYSGKFISTLGEQKRTNPYLQFHALRDFLAAMGYA